MKTMLLSIAVALSLGGAPIGPAESEGAGDPCIETSLAAYPDATGRAAEVVTPGGPDQVPATGSEGGLQTANSLPRGFDAGAVASPQTQSARPHPARQQDGKPHG